VCDILVIPASEVDCERFFSKGRDLLAIRRYAISGETIRIIILLKGTLRSLRGLFLVEHLKKTNECFINVKYTKFIAKSMTF
jgi:hypothetical protein